MNARISILVVVLGGLLGLIGLLSVDVSNRLGFLENAQSDNRQWVLVQTEVEVLRMRLALSQAEQDVNDAQALNDFRLWFDVLYSRLTLFSESPLYAEFVRGGLNADRLAQVRAKMDSLVPLVDGPDAQLFARLPEIDRTASELHALARDLALDGLQRVSAGSDATRQAMATTLIRLALAAGAAFLFLGVFAIILARLYRLSRQQIHENQLTRDRLQMIIANSPDAIVVTNRGGWTVEFNPAAEAMFGISRDSILGQQVVQRVVRPEKLAEYQALISRMMAESMDGAPRRFELEALRSDGSAFPVELSVAIRGVAKGSLMVGFIRDISDRKAADSLLRDALVKARAGERAKAEFLAVMSHEMRTPLNGLIGSMGVLQTTALSEDQRELLRIMQASGDILLGHVNSVLDIARAEAGDIQIDDVPFDLDRLIDGAIANQSSLARQNGTELRHVPLTGPFRLVRGDPARLRQILLNLIGNAVKFTRDGTIIVETERLDPQTVKGRPGMVEFRVIDTGIGISPEDQERIFEDFETIDAGYARQSGGTGLGLGIVRRLTHAMGGEVGVESDLGEGSVFWLRLPLRPSDAVLPKAGPLVLASSPTTTPEPPRPAVPARDPASRKLDVLVIEDNDINRYLMRRILEEAGHRVTEARDGRAGVEIATRRYFDTILTDISMPNLDGIETTRQIRATQGPSSRSRIVAITAHALPSEIDRFLEAGMNACLTKPVVKDLLLAQIGSPTPLGLIPESEEDVPLLDLRSLRDLHGELGGEMLQTLLSRLSSEATEKVGFICAQHEASDEMARAAHQLAGGCATFGARKMRNRLARIENAIKAGDHGAALRCARELPGLWDKTQDLIRAETERLAG